VTGTDVEKAVRALYADLLDAWNRRDARDFAKLFAADGQMVGFDGSQVAGSEIESHLGPIFESHPTAEYVATVREVRPAGGQAAVLRAAAGMVPPGQDRVNPDVNAVQSLVAEEDDGTWSIVLFQTTPAQYHGRPDLAERHTAEIQQLVDGAPPA
jgi:uncharacterized protein (TIGR02246 family)